MDKKEEIHVEFKEIYMGHSVKRTCYNMSRAEVVEKYGLTEPDIEWYRFLDDEE